MSDPEQQSVGGEAPRPGGAEIDGDIRTGGGDFVGRDQIVLSGNIIVLSSLPETMLQQLARMADLRSESLAGALAGSPHTLTMEDRMALLRSIDQVLGLFEAAAHEGVVARGVSAGQVQISRVELLLKKAILLRVEAEEAPPAPRPPHRAVRPDWRQEETGTYLETIGIDVTARHAKLEKAYTLLQEANSLDPTNTDVLMEMAELLVALTPNDPGDEERILRRIQRLLQVPKSDRERFQLAQATFLLATARDMVDRELVVRARGIFESLRQAEWVQQCDMLLAGTPVEIDAEGPVSVEADPGRTKAATFTPAGRWHIQAMDALGSLMFVDFHPNGTYESVQQVDSIGLSVQGAGQWSFNSFNNALEIQGLIDGRQPFVLGIFIQGQQPNGYYGLGTDGIGYLLTQA